MPQTDTSNISQEGIPIDWPQIQAVLEQAKQKNELYSAIVNTPFSDKLLMAQLGIGIIVFLMVNKKAGTIDRVALSNTEQAQGTLDMSAKKFEDIKIPLDEQDNILARSIREKKFQQTDDWQYLFKPELSPEQARFNQAGGGIACSIVYPLIVNGNAVGNIIFSYYKRLTNIGTNEHAFMRNYSQMAASLLNDS